MTLVWRIWCVLALVALGAGIASSQAWDASLVPADDNAVPPYVRPPIADALPSAPQVETAVGVSFQVQDGPPMRQALYYSTSPTATDYRNGVVAEAWAAKWSSIDARTDLEIEVARAAVNWENLELTQSCTQGSDIDWGSPYTVARRADIGDGGALVCATLRDGPYYLYVSAVTWDEEVAEGVEQRIRVLTEDVVAQLPEAEPPTADTFRFDRARARVNAIYLLAVVLVPLVWLVPNLLLDVATWDRLRRSALVAGRRPRGLGGVDADPLIRRRRWRGWAIALSTWAGVVWLVRMAEERNWGGLMSSLSIASLVVIVALAPRVVSALRSGRVQPYGPREVTTLAAGGLASLLVVGAAFTLLQFGGAYLATPDLLGDVSSSTVSTFGYVVLLLALGLLPLARVPFLLIRQRAMLALRDRDTRDQRAPILLLRSFGDDERRLRRHSSSRGSLVDQLSLRRLERFEEVVAHVLRTEGPVVAVGQVGERMPPPLGAIRMQLSNEEWQGRVTELLRRSQLICLTVGRSQSLAWEVERIASSGLLHKTLFLLPPVPRQEELARLSALADMLGLQWSALVPDPVGRVLAVWVPTWGGRPFTVTALAREDIGYEVAVDMVLGLMRGGAGTPGRVIHPSPTRPPVVIHPVGRAPAYDPSAIRLAPLVLAGFVVVGVVAAMVLPRLGLTGDVAARRVTVPIPSGVVSTFAAHDAEEDTFYVSTYSGDIGVLDFDPPQAQGLLKEPVVSALAAGNGRVFLVSPARDAVVAVDGDSGEQLWRASLDGPRDLLATRGRLLVVESGREGLVELDPATGAVLRRVPLDGVPWAIAGQRDDVWVTLYDRGEVVRLDASLAVRDVVSTPVGPAQVEATHDRVWIMSPLEHIVTAVTGPPARVWITRQDARISASDDLLVIEGIQKVTVIPDDRGPVSFAFDERSLGAVLASPGGRLLVARAGAVDLIEPDL